MCQLEQAVKEAETYRWAQANRDCKITEVPNWLIMTLMEDIIYSGCNLIEQLVIVLHGSWVGVMQEGYLECAAEKLMTNVLLASLYEDGYIEISNGSPDDPRFFDFHHEIDINITLTPSGEEAQVWEELDLFGRGAHQAMLQ
jgi:hypothetical protein